MIFYLLALLPILAWGIQWCFNRQIVWKEAAIGAAAALIVAIVFQVIDDSDVWIPADTETWSGRVQYAQYQPRWKEYYEEAIYRTESYQCGTAKSPQTCYRQVFDHWESRTCWHNEEWWTNTELGTFSVDKNRYADVLKEFGDVKQVPGKRRSGQHNSRMLEGPANDDRAVNKNQYVYPVTTTKKFDNRLLKATDTLYSFTPVTAEQTKGLYAWPDNADRFDTQRLLGTANQLWSQRSWDQMNAVLGPEKFINLIGIGFPTGTSLETGILQERYWHGGKKNDLVLTFGGDPYKPEWAYVFGWTEKQTVKRLLENRLRENTASISEISRLVRDEYELLPFEEKFEHVEIQTPWWYYLIFFLVVSISQGAAHFAFSRNNISK